MEFSLILLQFYNLAQRAAPIANAILKPEQQPLCR